MRCQGFVDSPGEVGADGHACWGYEDLAGDFRDAAVAFLAEGVELGQDLMFVGGPAAEDVVRSVEPLSSMVADGSLRVVPFDAVYPGGRRLPDTDQWRRYANATDLSRRGGATGLRVLAEVTALASAPGAWQGHARWESYADRRMPDFAMAALCCFDRSAVPREGLATIASAHPLVDRRLDGLVPFRVFGRDDALAIAGEVDAFSSRTLRRLLGVDDGAPAGLTLDLGGLTFIDHTGVQVLHEYAERVRSRGHHLTVRGGPSTLHRIADVLQMPL